MTLAKEASIRQKVPKFNKATLAEVMNDLNRLVSFIGVPSDPRSKDALGMASPGVHSPVFVITYNKLAENSEGAS